MVKDVMTSLLFKDFNTEPNEAEKHSTWQYLAKWTSPPVSEAGQTRKGHSAMSLCNDEKQSETKQHKDQKNRNIWCYMVLHMVSQRGGIFGDL